MVESFTCRNFTGKCPRTLNLNIGLDFEEQTRTKLCAVTVCSDLKNINIIYWTTEADLLTFKLK